MLKLNSGQRIYLALSLLVAGGALFMSLVIPRVDLQIAVNRLNTPFSGQFFRFFTLLGDGGVMLLPVFLAVVFMSYRKAFALLTAYVFSGVGTQFIKRVLWPDALRPLKYFEAHGIDYRLDLVPGVDVHAWHSFPSGHTATAFGLFILLGLFSRKTLVRSILLLLAAGVGLSRIWLSQHFLIDVAAGALLGILSAAGAWVIWFRRETVRLDSNLLIDMKDRYSKKRKITT